MSIQIVPLDVADDATFDGYHRAFATADTHYPAPTPWTHRELHAQLSYPVDGEVNEAFVGLVDGEVVGGLAVEYSTVDNLDKAYVDVAVLPDRQRRGYGTALVDFAERRARELGRPTLIGGVQYPTDAERDYPYRRFAAKHGFTESIPEAHRVLDTPADEAGLAALEQTAAPHHEDYTFWLGRDVDMPEEMIAPYVAMANRILVDAPNGDIDFEESGQTAEQWKERFALREKMGRRMYICAALDRDGVPVAHNQLVLSDDDPGKIFLYDTLVHADHRGHRLGMAVKVRNQRFVQSLVEGPALVHTWNARENSYMIAVNEQMGYRVAGYAATLQRKL